MPSPPTSHRAYTAAREIFDMRKLWARIEGLDNKVTASLQYGMMYQTSRLLRHATYWLLAHRRRELHIDRAVDGVPPRRATSSKRRSVTCCVGADRDRYEKVRKEHLDAGAPAELAARVACLDANNAALDIVELANAHGTRVVETARIYFEVGTRTGLDWMRQQVEQLAVDGPSAGRRAHRVCATTPCAFIAGLAERVLDSKRTRHRSGAGERRGWTRSVKNSPTGNARSRTCVRPGRGGLCNFDASVVETVRKAR